MRLLAGPALIDREDAAIRAAAAAVVHVSSSPNSRLARRLDRIDVADEVGYRDVRGQLLT